MPTTITFIHLSIDYILELSELVAYNLTSFFHYQIYGVLWLSFMPSVNSLIYFRFSISWKHSSVFINRSLVFPINYLIISNCFSVLILNNVILNIWWNYSTFVSPSCLHYSLASSSTCLRFSSLSFTVCLHCSYSNINFLIPSKSS